MWNPFHIRKEEASQYVKDETRAPDETVARMDRAQKEEV